MFAMILDKHEQLVASSFGWVEHGGFVVRNIETGEIAHYPGDRDSFLRLFAIDGERFLTAMHSSAADSVQLTVRSFADPANALWSLQMTPRSQSVSGDYRAAAGIRKHHLVTFKNGGRWDHHLLSVAADGSAASLGDLHWYNEDSYDLMYQGLTDVVALPNSELVLVSVQRSSTVIVHDQATSHEVGRIDLANRLGNPMLQLVGGDLLTVDYDTFVRVDLTRRRVLRKVLLQDATQGVRHFVGNLFFWQAEGKAVIARPFSGDVVVLCPNSGRVESTLAVGSQPLDCVVTSGGRVLARSWKTGAWLDGRLPNRRRYWWRFW